ncbi:MAG: cobalt-precorrin-5B (C(1))-methyltransferase CbiD [Lachnospiraceae bacterium]|nr:cobalt-precorrin-5B (C(1))-methyltransferase CbiD [Lachnospiraceae bacterium]
METYVTKNQRQLRCGVTTGTCAAAAAKAAALKLLIGCSPVKLVLMTPKGIEVEAPVVFSGAGADYAEYFVVKDSGDDPDVTNNSEIHVRVEKVKATDGFDFCFRSESYPWLFLDGGDGIGRVTKAGLEQAAGFAAINKVPRKMIFDAVGEVCSAAGCRDRLIIRVSSPQGEELAKRTFNPRLGIEGGISILGTSGILEPMSEKAIVDTIEAEIRQRSVCGEKAILITPGNYGQAYIEKYLNIEMERSVKCSNYIGETLDLAVSCGIESVLLVGNVGKLVKLAAGIMNTHSRVADGRWEIFAAHAALCGAGTDIIRSISRCVNTEEMLRLLDGCGLREAVMESICVKLSEALERRSSGRSRFGAMLFSESYGFIGQTKNAQCILKELKR